MSDRPLGQNWPNAYYEMKERAGLLRAEVERLEAALHAIAIKSLVAQPPDEYAHRALEYTRQKSKRGTDV